MSRAELRLVVLLLFGMALVAHGYTTISDQSERISESEPVNATVLSTDIEKLAYNGTGSGAGGTAYYPIVEYRYTVDGETYTNDKVYPEGLRGGDEDWAKGVAEDYEEGEEITAYYDPSDPSESFLIREGPLAPTVFIVAGLLVMAVGVGTFVRG